jgi:hypothetical protein
MCSKKLRRLEASRAVPEAQEAAVGWLCHYAKNIAQGFTKIQQLHQQGMPRTEAFAQAFGVSKERFVSSTVWENEAAWLATPGAVMKAAVAAGESDSGLWGPIFKRYKLSQR